MWECLGDMVMMMQAGGPCDRVDVLGIDDDKKRADRRGIDGY